MLLTKEVTLKWHKNHRDYYESKGYIFTKIRDEFIVKTEDLHDVCTVRVNCKCDKCGRETNLEYRKYIENIKRNGHYQCTECGNDRHSHEEIEQMFRDAGYELISRYKNIFTKVEYICPIHGKQTVIPSNFLSGRRCKKCAADKLRVPYEDVKRAFEEREYTLVSKEYKGNKQLLKYICWCDPTVIHKIKYNDLQQGHGCPACKARDTSERQKGEGSHFWNGGVSNLSGFLRNTIGGWKYDSMKACGFKCVLTGEKFDAVHHLTSFSYIMHEMLEELNMDIREQVSMYTEEELEIMSNRIVAKHNDYGLGICLCDRLHKLFHKLYGKVTVTPEYFEEFKQRYEAGEFDE